MLVYKVTNLANGKVYIGKTMQTIGRRWTYHKYQAKIRGGCPHLGAAIRKHGSGSFKVEPLCTAESAEELNRLEMQAIADNHSNDPSRGYNLTAGGEGSIGFHQSEKQKVLMRNRIGAKHPMFGRHHTSEARQAISKAMKGECNPFFGKKHSAETLLRIKETLKTNNPHRGKHLSIATRKKIRNSNSHPYVFIAPNGQIMRGVGMKAFCAANGLSRSKVSELHRGHLLRYRGWVKGD